MPHFVKLVFSLVLCLILGSLGFAVDKAKAPPTRAIPPRPPEPALDQDVGKKKTPKPKAPRKKLKPAPKKKDLIITDESQANADFAAQGEYGGFVQSLAGELEVGIQVIALGDGKFTGVWCPGGLPGAGWNHQEPSEMTGELTDKNLILVGSANTVVIAGKRGKVFDLQGNSVGWLRKVRRVSRTLGAAPPPGATVLFDGTSVEQFENGKINDQGWLMPGAITKQSVGDFHLHMEFRTPFRPYAKGQGRGNSGVYIQQRYEVQVLDSFGLSGEANECGGLYKQRKPDVNMCLPPLAWQTYDIYFRAARFDEQGEKTSPAVITVFHNGVKIHDNYALENKTGNGKPEGPEPRPILLQNHGNPVQFRNVWMVDYAPLPEAYTLAPAPSVQCAPPWVWAPNGCARRRPTFFTPTWRRSCRPLAW